MTTVNPCVIHTLATFFVQAMAQLYVGVVHLSFESSFNNKEEDRNVLALKRGHTRSVL